MRQVSVGWIGCVLVMLWLTGCSGTPSVAADRDSSTSGKIAPVLTNFVQQLQSGAIRLPATGPVRSDKQGRIQIYVYVTDTSSATVSALHDRGLQNAIASPEMHIVQGWIKPEDLVNLAALPFVTRITPPQYGRPR